ncbi:hypothetical protein [Duganella sp.]|uniref:hypothetical protein n=1 Tax=Duganella sp. TaxID=1904440 RepID=UPI0031E19A0D
MRTNTNFVFASSDMDALKPECGDRRFFAIDETKLSNAQLHAAHLHAHADHLTAYQRASGARIRQCSTGCFSIYNVEGRFIARTPPPGTLAGLPAAAMKVAASQMAYSDELAGACRAVDADFERNGAVSAETVTSIRNILNLIGAA